MWDLWASVLGYLSQKTAQDVERLSPHVRQLSRGLSVHWVRISVLLLHLQETELHITKKIYCERSIHPYLVIRDSVKFRQQFDAVLPSDQNALQCLTVLLHLLGVHGPPQSFELTRMTCNSMWITWIRFSTCTWSSVKMPSMMR